MRPWETKKNLRAKFNAGALSVAKVQPPAVAPDVLNLVTETTFEPLRKGRIRQYLNDIAQSPKRYLRTFRSVTGWTPKTYLQLVQVNRALQRIAADPSFPLTHLASDTGFYDQAHFMRVFNKFTQISPSVYRRLVRSQKVVPSFPNTIVHASTLPLHALA